MKSPLRIGTRGSALALWQANHVADRLREINPGGSVELVIIQTHGDRVQDVLLAQVGGDGLFTKAIQDALLANQADVAVHSLKDLPTAPVPGLTLAAVPTRGPSGDALVSRRVRRFDDLPAGSRVATGSVRRRAQILHRRPDLQMVEIRGNVDTRLRKLDELKLDGLILAEAGLQRLGLGQEIVERLDPAWMLPAVGQGALGLECRTSDDETRQSLAELDDPASRWAVTAERALLFALGGGCQVPVGALGTQTGAMLELRAAIVSPDGRTRLERSLRDHPENAAKLGQSVAEQLISGGGRALLDAKR